jgi:hypothetical protein
VLDETRGSDTAVIDQANERASLAPGRVARRAVKPGDIARRDLRLVEDLPPPPKRFTLNFFEDSTRLMPDSAPVLAAIFADVRKRDGVDVLVIGHTDRLGSPADNDALSLKRAEEIREQLVVQGLDAAAGCRSVIWPVPVPNQSADARSAYSQPNFSRLARRNWVVAEWYRYIGNHDQTKPAGRASIGFNG